MAAIGFGKRSGLTPPATASFGSAKTAGRALVTEPITPEGRLSAKAVEPIPTPGASDNAGCVWDIHALIAPQLPDFFPREQSRNRARAELAVQLEEMVQRVARDQGIILDDAGVRDTVTVLLNELVATLGGLQPDPLGEA
ncbi:MAG: CpaF family protein, partial [Sphingomonadaceae bacterium]|nr:CpaF family protein [Sphingomonadaceae bacterium]